MMMRLAAGAALLLGSGAALAANAPAPAPASSPTDFGVRLTAGAKMVMPIVHEGGSSASWAPSSKKANMSAAAKIGSAWGRVTSTYRTPAHNRAVGGVPNSFHLSGRAIDIARRAGVRHSDIAAAFRSAGYHLIESLDEGDHSHFAFGSGSGSAAPYRAPIQINAPTDDNQRTAWRFVYAPGGGR